MAYSEIEGPQSSHWPGGKEFHLRIKISIYHLMNLPLWINRVICIHNKLWIHNMYYKAYSNMLNFDRGHWKSQKHQQAYKRLSTEPTL